MLESTSPSIVSFFTHMIWGTITAFFPLYAINHGMAIPGSSLALMPSSLFWRVLWAEGYWIFIVSKRSSCLA